MSWEVGVTLCLAGAATTNLGMNLQKKSHIQNSLLDIEQQRGVMSQPLWRAGFAVFIAGQLLNFGALSFASQSLLATLGSFSLVTNTVFAPWLLKEKTSWRHYAATLIICGGAVVVVLYSSHAKQDFTLHDLEQKFEAEAFIIYAAAATFIATLCLLLYIARRNSEKHAQIVGVGCATVAAVLGSFSFLLAKCTTQLVKATVNGQNQFSDAGTYFVVSIFLFCAVFSVHFLNLSLQLGSVLLIVPTYFVQNTLLSIIGGILYFEEWGHFTLFTGLMFIGGVALTLLGVFVLSRIDVADDDAESIEFDRETSLANRGYGSKEGDEEQGEVGKLRSASSLTESSDAESSGSDGEGVGDDGSGGDVVGDLPSVLGPGVRKPRRSSRRHSAMAGGDKGRPRRASGGVRSQRARTSGSVSVLAGAHQALLLRPGVLRGRRRFSLHPEAFPGSFPARAGAAEDGAAGGGAGVQKGKRRYSVSLLGLGIA